MSRGMKRDNCNRLEVRIILKLSAANLDAKSKQRYKGNYFQCRILYPAKLSLKYENEDAQTFCATFSVTQHSQKFISSLRKHLENGINGEKT